MFRLACVVALLAFVASDANSMAMQSAPPSLAAIVRHVRTSVVSVQVSGHDVPARGSGELNFTPTQPDDKSAKPPQEDLFLAFGSGLVIDADNGYILTSRHTLENAEVIDVTLSDGRELSATRVGSDPATDLAIVQVHASGLQAADLGDSSSLEVGDYVIALGNPFNLSQTVTFGIVSALGRSDLGAQPYENFIQTDASINPGSSGGPLVGLEGKVVGINSFLMGPSGGNVGVGFAVPINDVRTVTADMLRYGDLRRGALDVSVDRVDRGASPTSASQARIAEVAPGSTAEQAGLQPNDVIVALDGKAFNGPADLRNRISLMRAGAQVSITFERAGATKTVPVTLDEMTISSSAPGRQ